MNETVACLVIDECEWRTSANALPADRMGLANAGSARCQKRSRARDLSATYLKRHRRGICGVKNFVVRPARSTDGIYRVMHMVDT